MLIGNKYAPNACSGPSVTCSMGSGLSNPRSFGEANQVIIKEGVSDVYFQQQGGMKWTFDALVEKCTKQEKNTFIQLWSVAAIHTSETETGREARFLPFSHSTTKTNNRNIYFSKQFEI